MLPCLFLDRMRELLADEYPLFIESFDKPEVRGVRVNRIKCDVKRYIENTALPLSPIEYTADGFILDSDSPVGMLPEHHAGIIYMQDPGAMTPLSCIDIPEGARIVDLCAAPGGKSGQALSRLGEGGFLLANEYVPKRAKIIVSNFERLGVRCGMVTSLDTNELTKLYDSYFDIAICDVPCSGEGMFRKNPEAVAEWCESLPKSCAVRSLMILENAIKLTRGGGKIVYSTCTYSLEENEWVIKNILDKYPNIHILDIDERIKRVTCDGLNPFGEEYDSLKRCRRFYPHKSAGEGQFLAVLSIEDDDKMPTILYKGQEKPLSKSESAIVERFFSENLIKKPDAVVCKVSDNIVLIPHGVAVPPKSVFLAGVLLGELRKDILTPSHHFFSAYGDLFIRKYELSDKPDILAKYLRGEEIECECDGHGYITLTYLGASLGGGKLVLGRVKNYYPKGLRNK